MLMTALGLIRKHRCLTEAEARAGISGNLCCCTGYQDIVVAIFAVARAMHGVENPSDA
jgi:aerobic carbon-monoxide dehydrogenase small subunit